MQKLKLLAVALFGRRGYFLKDNEALNFAVDWHHALWNVSTRKLDELRIVSLKRGFSTLAEVCDMVAADGESARIAAQVEAQRKAWEARDAAHLEGLDQ